MSICRTRIDVLDRPGAEPHLQRRRTSSKERGVILEEIKMDEDNPDYLVHEIFTQNFWKDHPLGKPILGTSDTVQQASSRRCCSTTTGSASRPGTWWFPQPATSSTTSLWNWMRKFRPPSVRQQRAADRCRSRPPKISMRNKKALEQVQLCIGVPSYSICAREPLRLLVLNTLLGGGMSSRLFQNVREKQGLVYSIFSELNPYRDTGCLAVYAGTSGVGARRWCESVMRGVSAIKEKPVTAKS